MAAGMSLLAWSYIAHGTEFVTVNHQGAERRAIIHQPATTPPSPLPLIIALHGFGQTTESLRNWLRLDATADREGFRVVYPEAIDRLWSYGRPINRPMPTIAGETVDDVGFIRLLIDDSGKQEGC
jgi:polyhydroxybutyrate depolymerase